MKHKSGNIFILFVLLLSINVISIFAQDPTIIPTGAEDTVARLASDISKINNTNFTPTGFITYGETGSVITYLINHPRYYFFDDVSVPKSTTVALDTYYLLNEIQNEKINKGQMLFLKSEVTDLLKELEVNWAKRRNDAQAVSELENSYINAEEKIHLQVIRHAKSEGMILIVPYAPIITTINANVIQFDITITTNPADGRVWLVQETPFRIAKRNNVEPPWKEVGGTKKLSQGTYRYKVVWSNGQEETATAPFSIDRPGKLTLPGAIFTFDP